MKALSLQLRKDAAELPSGNGVVKQESVQPVFKDINVMDLNGTILEEPSSWPVLYQMASIDLNGATQQDPANRFVSCHPPKETNAHITNSDEPCVMSKDDIQKIQVL